MNDMLKIYSLHTVPSTKKIPIHKELFYYNFAVHSSFSAQKANICYNIL
jgi:hypothetical protein